MGLIDLHAHLGIWPFPIPTQDPVVGLIKLFRDYHIELAVVSSAKAICYDMAEGNEDVAKALPKTRLLRGYVYVNPNYPNESCREMDLHLAKPGFVGVKIHPSYAQCPLGSEPLSRLIDEVATRTKLVKIHTYNAADAGAARKEAEKHPELNFVLAHACAGATRDAADVAAEFPNVYLEFSCSLAERGRVEYSVRTCGASQIVFGSDMDLLDPAFALGMFDGAHLSDEDRQAIMHDNAARLLSLS